MDDEQRITQALRGIGERRAVIEQAKGILMLAYGVDADEAFGLLCRQSQNHNVKVHHLAAQLLEDVRLTATRSVLANVRSVCGDLLSTAHERASPTPRPGPR